MRKAARNILDAIGKVDAICITTNGFTTKHGRAVMGRGIALSIKSHVPNIENILGSLIKKNGNITQIITEINGTKLISVPSKPITVTFDGSNIVQYQQSNFNIGDTVPGFFAKSDTTIINQSLIDLVALTKDMSDVVIPLIGCGAGELSYTRDVKHLMEQHLDNKFIACSFNERDFYK